jgi:hypothetical protein
MLLSSITKSKEIMTWTKSDGLYYGYDGKFEKIEDAITAMNDDFSAAKITRKTFFKKDDIIAEIKEIDILNTDKFEQYKDLIRPISRRWWLKDHGENSWFVQVAHTDMDRKCVRDPRGDHVTAVRHIRPTLLVELPVSDTRVFYKPDKLIGQRIQFKGYMWTILDVNAYSWYLFCDTTIGEHCYALTDVGWEDSELKRWLETDCLQSLMNNEVSE